MTQPPEKKLNSLFRGLLDAAKSLDWHPNSDPGIIHSNARKVDWERDWEAEREQTLRLVLPHDIIIHLQIRLERLGKEERHRIIIFGRRVKGLQYATLNTQRATFNSDHADELGFWLRPNLDAAEKTQLSKLLSGPTFPCWNGKRIQLGSDVPYVTLRRFLIALSAIEQVKGGWAAGPLPFAPELDRDGAEFETGDAAIPRCQRVVTARWRDLLERWHAEG